LALLQPAKGTGAGAGVLDWEEVSELEGVALGETVREGERVCVGAGVIEGVPVLEEVMLTVDVVDGVAEPGQATSSTFTRLEQLGELHKDAETNLYRS